MKKLFAAVAAAVFLLTACAERSITAAGSAGTDAGASETDTAESVSESAAESTAENTAESEDPAGTASTEASELPAGSGDTIGTESTAESAAETVFASVDDWRLVLVNPWHKLEGEMDVDLVLPPSGRNENRHMVDRRIVDDLEEMIAAAKSDGVSLLIDYGYRSFAQSEALFEKQINSQLAANPSYTREQAEEAAKAWVAPPGTSDHHTGLALDIVTPDYQMLNDGFADTPAGQWMAEHSWEYGFVIRFPKDKTDITGITYESWHLRYVGRDNAKTMHENNWCLEEYVEYLTQQQ